jgi:hypothetical protein
VNLGLCRVCSIVGRVLEQRHSCGGFLVELGYHQSFCSVSLV